MHLYNTSEIDTSPCYHPNQLMKVTVSEAAKLFGISDNAVRMRIQRGKLQSTKIHNTVYVEIDSEEPTYNTPNTDHTAGHTLLVETLQSQVEHLKQELSQAHESNRELRRLLAALTSRIPELPTSNTTASQDCTDTTQEPTEATEERSWFRRLFR